MMSGLIEQKMVKVSVEVRSGPARFRVGVQAQNTGEALSLLRRRYSRGGVELVFPIEPEGYFVHEPAASTELVAIEQAHQDAA